MLLSNGISFALQIVVFLFLGSFAGKLYKIMVVLMLELIRVDFGTWRPNILIVLSLVAWGIGFGWLGVHDASKWEVATGMYIVGRKISNSAMKCVTDIISHCISDNVDFLDCCVCIQS